MPLPAFCAETRHLWIRTGRDSGNLYQRVPVHLTHSGNYAEIFVESALIGIVPESDLRSIHEQLESQSNSPIQPQQGLAQLVSHLYGPFPAQFDERGRIKIVIVDSGTHDLSQYQAFVSFRDQWTLKYAESLGFKSNEGNYLYAPVTVFNKDRVLRNIMRALPKFSQLKNISDSSLQSTWLTESLGETALFVGGFFDRDLLRFAANPHLYSLTHAQSDALSNPLFSLFGSFLLDSMKDKQSGLTFLTRLQASGREAVESFFRMESSRPLTFDVIFANFVNYLFANEGMNLPISVATPDMGGGGMILPAMIPFTEVKSYPFEMDSKIYSYGFLSLSLKRPLPAGAIVDIQNTTVYGPRSNCSKSASLLWKPINPKKIVLYSVGCDPISAHDLVNFRLRIFDKPSFFPFSPLKILP